MIACSSLQLVVLASALEVERSPVGDVGNALDEVEAAGRSPPSFEIRARFIATEPGMPAPPGPNERFDDTDRGEDARTAPSAERGELPLLSNGLTERRRGVGPDSCAGDPRLCRGELALKAAALLCMPSFERLWQRACQSSGSRQ